MTNLISRLAAGERWDGDNAEVLRARGWEEIPYRWKSPDGKIVWKSNPILPLDSLDDALALKNPSDRATLIEGDNRCTAHLSRRNPAGWRLFEGDAPTLRAALCIAILRAGESRE